MLRAWGVLTLLGTQWFGVSNVELSTCPARGCIVRWRIFPDTLPEQQDGAAVLLNVGAMPSPCESVPLPLCSLLGLLGGW